MAPPSFHGEIVAGPGYHRAQATVVPPVVSAGVRVAIPPPPQVQVGIGFNIGGPPPVVIEQRREVYEVREHHDHGRHNGWYKHGHEHGHPNEGWRGEPPSPPPPQRSGGWRAPPAPHKEKPSHGGGWHR